jgi:hypothetical protein
MVERFFSEYLFSVKLYMKKYFVQLLIITALINLLSLLSCSQYIEKQKSNDYESFQSRIYEDSAFTNSSLTICIPDLDTNYNERSDSAFQIDRDHFFDSFKKYFPEALKMFSAFNQISWKFFEPGFSDETIDLSFISSEGEEFTYLLNHPVSFYTKDIGSDFFILITELMCSKQTPSDNTGSSTKINFATTVAMSYSIWDVKNSNLISVDRVESTTEFKTLTDKWPYRGVIFKLVSEMADKLPMFSK